MCVSQFHPLILSYNIKLFEHKYLKNTIVHKVGMNYFNP